MRPPQILFVAATWLVGCHTVPSELDEYCHDTPMAAECPEGTCSGPYECIAYCVEHYPEHTGIPASGTGAWCDDLGTPSEYSSFCSEHPEVDACTAWCDNHSGACSISADADADADSDADSDGDDDGDGGVSCGNDDCDSTEDAESCPADCPAQCGDGHITHDEDCEPGDTQPCITTCETDGTQSCETVACLWSEFCEPPVELCDSIDQNCDGEADEDCPCAQEWVEEDLPIGLGRISCIFGTESNEIYAIGAVDPHSVLLRYDGSDWVPIGEYPAILTGLWGSSADDLHSVGLEGEIAHFDGESWSSETSPTDVKLLDIWGISDTDIFAVGDVGTIVHFDGSEWSIQDTPTTSEVRGIWGDSSDDVWAACDDGVLHYDGFQWEFDSSATGSFFGIHGYGRSGAIAVGNSIIGFDGSDWFTLESENVSDEFFGVFIVREGTIYVVGSEFGDVDPVPVNGFVRHYDGFSPNTTLFTLEDSYLMKIWASSPYNVFVGGYEIIGEDLYRPVVLHRCGSDW